MLPHEALATCSRCGRHGTLERKWFDFRGGPDIKSTFQHELNAQLEPYAKTHHATWAKLQPPSTYVLLIKMDAGIPKHPDSKRYLCAYPVLREGDIDPRSRAMKPCNENDIFHAGDTTTKALRNLEAGVDILEHPFAEITASHGVLAFC